MKLMFQNFECFCPKNCEVIKSQNNELMTFSLLSTHVHSAT